MSFEFKLYCLSDRLSELEAHIVSIIMLGPEHTKQ